MCVVNGEVEGEECVSAFVKCGITLAIREVEIADRFDILIIDATSVIQIAGPTKASHNTYVAYQLTIASNLGQGER